MSRHLGLIIGIDQYRDSTFQRLQFAANDARALAQWFVNTKGGKWSPPDVQLLQGPHATRELVEALITQICMNKAEAGDVVFIYFAGHAFVDEKSGEGYLALHNTRYENSATALPLTSFAQHIMSRSPASQFICVLDCFQNGKLWGARRTTPHDFKPLLGPSILNTLPQMPGRFFLCSCRGNEMAAEAGERNLGLFTHRTILGLCGPAADYTGAITLEKLYPYLTGVLGEPQRPQLFGTQRDPLVLVGDIPSSPQQQKPFLAGPGISPAFSGMPSTPAPQTTSNLKPQDTPFATATAPVQPQQGLDPETSGHLLSSALDQQRQQQCQQMLAQAQEFFKAQKFGEAFDLVDRVLQISPGDTTALTLKAQLLGTAGRFPEALAVVDQLGQTNPNNPMAWSMRAVLLSNTGQHQPALAAIERSLELDPQNPESYAIKNNIMANLALEQSRNGSQPLASALSSAPEQTRGGPRSLFTGFAIQVLGFVLGTVGAVLPIFLPSLPVVAAWLLISVGLALLCVNAARGAYRYGIARLLITLLMCLVSGGLLGGIYKIGYTRIIATLQTKAHQGLLAPVLLFAAWLIIAATLPLVLAIGGLIAGLIARALGRGRGRNA